jgi:inner membrane protein
MDPITHTLAGAVMARAGGDRKTPLAAATLMLAANAPDVDIISTTWGSYASIAFRRGWTHGPIALLILPLVITIAILAWDRVVRLRRHPDARPVDAQWTLALALIGCVSHPMLDWLNTYGIRMLMPFSRTWFYGDALFIIDPYWWVLLGSTLALARKGASLRTVRGAAALALVYPLLLIGVSRVGNRLAVDAAAAEGISDVREILYQPAMFNPLRAQLIAVTDEAYHFGTLQWFGTPRVRFGETVIARGDWTDARVIAARADLDARDFLIWSRYPWVRIDTTAADGSAAVVFGDARFPEGGLAGGLGGLRVTAR